MIRAGDSPVIADICAFLPWVTAKDPLFGSVEAATGMQYGGDGPIALAIGAAVAFIGLFLLAARTSAGLRLLAVMGGVVLAGFGVVEITTIQRRIDLSDYGSMATIGYGLYVIVAAGLGAVLGGLAAGSRSSRR